MSGYALDDANPTGVTSFDHAKLAALAEYWPAVRALWDLRRAVVAAGADMPWDGWLGVVHAVVAAPFFVDVCPCCLGSRVPPYAAEVAGDELRGAYRCTKCLRAWTCSWVTWAPVADPYTGLDGVPFDVPEGVEEQPWGDAA